MLALLLACAGAPNGASEPLVVREGTFFEGDLPTNDAATTPSVIYVASVGYVVTQGQGNVRYTGLASTDAYSVAVALPDQGTGYWIVPVDSPDPTQDDNYLFDLTADFSRATTYGLTSLSFVALDANASPGPRYDATLCILPDFADTNFAECDPETPPQHTVLSLTWDTNVDLDLLVVTPSGKVVSPDSPSTLLDEDDESEPGVLTRDSNDNCVVDNIRLESLVFEEEPPAGEYVVYASLHSPCGEPSVNFRLTQHTRVDNADGTWSTESVDLATGALLAEQADGGATLGTRLATVTLP